MAIISINANVNGQSRSIEIDNDPSWGKTQILMKSAIVSDGRGGQRTDMNEFFNKLLELVIVSGLDEVKDKTKFLQIPTSEMTYILGEILKIIPLQKYFDNLGITPSQIAQIV